MMLPHPLLPPLKGRKGPRSNSTEEDPTPMNEENGEQWTTKQYLENTNVDILV